MTTLREEIEEHLRFRFYKGNAMPYPDRVANEIISKIEKRIDEILKEEPYNTIDYAEGFARALRKVKEMLK